jgi:hypothetical protein
MDDGQTGRYQLPGRISTDNALVVIEISANLLEFVGWLATRK